MRAVCGAPSIFLCKLAGIIKSEGGKEELDQVESLLKKSLPQKRRSLDYISIQERWMDSVIFGAGEYGIRLKYELNARGIFPQCFVDNNPEKAGTLIDGIPCYSVEYVRQLKDIKIIVAQRIYGAAYAQLQTMGIQNIALKDEVDAELLNIEPYQIESNAES